MDETVKPLRIPPQMSVYADKHNVFQLLQSLLSSLVVERPSEPLNYLISLLQRSSEDIPRVLVLGPTAVGKSTLAKQLSSDLRAVHVTAEKLMEFNMEMNPQSRHAEEEPRDDLLVRLVQQRLREVDCFNRGWVLDGIPECRLQALSLQQAGVIADHAVMLEAPDEVLVERARGKLVDPLTGDVFHEKFIPSTIRSVSERLRRGWSQFNEATLLAEVQRYRCEVTGLQSAYQNVLKSFNADQPPRDLHQQALTFVQTRHRCRTPRILLLGPPGSGKRLQARRLADKYKMVDVCCSELLRSVAAGSSELGERIHAYIEEGRPVPTAVVLQVLEERLNRVDCSVKGWVVHGFPRDRQQAKSLLETPHTPNRVFMLELTEDLCYERICLRATDPVSGERYHAVSRPPPTIEVENRLETRPEDHRNILKHSLNQYTIHTAELMSVFPDMVHIEADQDPHTVFEALESRLTIN